MHAHTMVPQATVWLLTYRQIPHATLAKVSAPLGSPQLKKKSGHTSSLQCSICCYNSLKLFQESFQHNFGSQMLCCKVWLLVNSLTCPTVVKWDQVDNLQIKHILLTK